MNEEPISKKIKELEFYCPHCMKKVDVTHIIKPTEIWPYHNHEFTLENVPVVICKECGGEIWYDDFDFVTLQRVQAMCKQQYPEEFEDDPEEEKNTKEEG